MSEQTIDREIMSPEGIEELVKWEVGFRITLTGGGKYRVYMIEGERPQPITSTDTLEKAQKECARGMTIHAAMIVAPEETLSHFAKLFKKL